MITYKQSAKCSNRSIYVAVALLRKPEIEDAAFACLIALVSREHLLT